MTIDLFVNGSFSPLHAIFVRDAGRLSDAELLMPLGLAAYRRGSSVEGGDYYVALANVGEWTMIADDLAYRLFNMRTAPAAIQWFARTDDVFTYVVGDADPSFGLEYYRGGRAIRRYIVDYPDYHTPKVVADEGERFPQESALMRQHDSRPVLLDIAASLGIILPRTAREIRLWVSPGDATSDDDADA